MRLKNHYLAFIMAMVMGVSSIVLFSGAVQAADNILVIVDGQAVSFGEVAPQIINSRTMVPVRALAESMGASVNWNDVEKKVTITSGNQYAVLSIGSPAMTYGSFGKNEAGSTVVLTTEIMELDSPPVIVNSFSLFPASAIAKAFGAEVTWIDSTKTVLITTKNGAQPTPEPVATPAPTPTPTPQGPQDPAFADSTYFQEVSATRLQEMYTGKSKIAAVIYDGKNADAIAAMPMIKGAAQGADFKVYGFDTTSTRFANPQNLKWVWDVVDRSDRDYPIILLYYGEDKPVRVKSDISQSALEDLLWDLQQEEPTALNPTPTPTPTPTATPTPTPSGDPDHVGTKHWRELDVEDSIEMMDSGKKFIFVLYNSEDDSDKYEDYVDNIKLAAQEANVQVYYYDTDGDKIEDWFVTDYLGQYFYNPSIIMVDRFYIQKNYKGNTSYADLVKAFKDFLK